MLQQAELYRVPNPSKHDFAVLQGVLYPAHGPDVLGDVDAMPWQEDTTDDLIALSAWVEFDAATAFIVEKLIPWLYRKIYQRAKVHLYYNHVD